MDEADPAGIKTAPLNETVQLSKNVPFYRWADRNPTPTITWVHESGAVGRGNKLHFGLTRFTDAGWYTYDAESGTGERAYLDITGSESRLIKGKMVILNEKFDLGSLNKESEKYQNFSKRIAQVVEDLLKDDINYYATKGIQLEGGCVKLYFMLELKRIVRANIIVSALKYAAVDGKFGSFVVDPSSITVTQDETPASSSKNSTGEEGVSLWIFIVCILVFIVVIALICSSESHQTQRRDGETTSSIDTTFASRSGGGQSAGDERPRQDFYYLSRDKPDGTKEEETVFRNENKEAYVTKRKKPDGTREWQRGVRGDDVSKSILAGGPNSPTLLALDNN